MASEVTIFNMALNAVGTRDDVAATTEESREAEVCRRWFGPVRDHVLRAAHWPCAKTFDRLALLAERDDALAWTAADPEPGFLFAYAAPSDMLAPRYLTSFGRFTLGTYGERLAIMCQEEDTILCYTKRQTNIDLWDAQLVMAVAHALAAFIAMPLHGKAQRAQQAQNTANGLILEARVAAANSENNQFDTVPDWIAARGYSGTAPLSRYYYPFGPMIAATEMAGVA